MKPALKIKTLVFFSLTGLVIALDQLTKQLVITSFRYGESLPIVPDFFSLTRVHNTGAAFSLLAQWDASLRIPFFIAVPVIAAVFIGFLFRKLDADDMKGASILASVVGGAVGNLIDRITFGYVIDFLHFHWGVGGPSFPVFNVADCAICVGVFFLIIETYRKDQPPAPAGNDGAPHASGPV